MCLEIAGPGDRIVEGPAMFWEIEVLHGEATGVLELIEARDDLLEVHHSTWIIDMKSSGAGLPLAELDVVRKLEHLERVTAPVGHVTGVDEEA